MSVNQIRYLMAVLIMTCTGCRVQDFCASGPINFNTEMIAYNQEAMKLYFYGSAATGLCGEDDTKYVSMALEMDLEDFICTDYLENTKERKQPKAPEGTEIIFSGIISLTECQECSLSMKTPDKKYDISIYLISTGPPEIEQLQINPNEASIWIVVKFHDELKGLLGISVPNRIKQFYPTPAST